MNCRRGEIFFINKFNDPSVGSEQRQGRPFLVVSPNNMTKNGRGALCVPLTLQEKPPLSQHCKIDTFGKDATVLCEQIRYIDESYFGSYFATATDGEMAEVNKCLMEAVGIPSSVLLQSGDAEGVRKEVTRITERFETQIAAKDAEIRDLQKKIEALEIKEQAYISIIKG